MEQQMRLCFRRSRAETLWPALPEQSRQELITLYARLMVQAAQAASHSPQPQGRQEHDNEPRWR